MTEKLGNSAEKHNERPGEEFDYTPFDEQHLQRAEALREKAKAEVAAMDEVRQKAREEAMKDRPDITHWQLEEVEDNAEHYQKKLAKNQERAARLEVGEPVSVSVEENRFGKFFVPDTPALDDLLAGKGAFSKPLELMPMMEPDPKDKRFGSFKFTNRIDKQLAAGHRPTHQDIVDLNVRFLAYQEQSQHARGRKEQETYKNALYYLENTIFRAMISYRGNDVNRNGGRDRKIDPDSPLGVDISRGFAKLKMNAFYSTSQRKQEKFLHSREGGRDISAVTRFSMDFTPSDLSGDRDIEGEDTSAGGVWQQNRAALKMRQNEDAFYRERLQDLGIDDPSRPIK